MQLVTRRSHYESRIACLAQGVGFGGAELTTSILVLPNEFVDPTIKTSIFGDFSTFYTVGSRRNNSPNLTNFTLNNFTPYPKRPLKMTRPKNKIIFQETGWFTGKVNIWVYRQTSFTISMKENLQ